MCSIHLDDATAAILCQNAHHTPAHWWRGNKVMKPISVWGWLGGHDGQRPMGKFGQDAGVTPLYFSKDILGFLMTTESQDLDLTFHLKDGAFLQYSVPVTTLGWGIRGLMVESRTQSKVREWMYSALSTFNTTTEVPLSKAPNPQLLPRRCSINGCPLLWVHDVCVFTAVCVHLDG